jgi:hypothetical protein
LYTLFTCDVLFVSCCAYLCWTCNSPYFSKNNVLGLIGLLQVVLYKSYQGREADHLPPSSAEVTNGVAVPPFRIHLQGALPNYLSTGTTLPFSN